MSDHSEVEYHSSFLTVSCARHTDTVEIQEKKFHNYVINIKIHFTFAPSKRGSSSVGRAQPCQG